MGMVSMVVGGVTDTAAQFVVKVDTGPAAVRYDTDSGFSSPTTSSSETVDADGVATVDITGLTAGARYYWQTVDNSTPDTGTTGQFLTHPAAAGTAGSYTLGCLGDAGQSPTYPGAVGGELDAARVSDHPVFATIRARALADDWVGLVNLGDWGYPDWSVRNTESLANRRTFWDDQLAQSRQGPLWREVASEYVWDDHCYAHDDSDGSYANKANAAQVFRERSPSWPLAQSSGPIYRALQVCRVLHVVLDTRYERDTSGTPTMLGSTQLAWLDSTLDASTAQALVLWSPTPWIGIGSDTWAGFTAERATIVTMVGDYGFSGRTFMVNADKHAGAIESGAGGNADFGGWPIMLCAPIDATPGSLTSQYDGGMWAARGQFGTLRVDDDGTGIAITGTVWRGTRALGWHTLSVGGSTALTAGNPSHALAL